MKWWVGLFCILALSAQAQTPESSEGYTAREKQRLQSQPASEEGGSSEGYSRRMKESLQSKENQPPSTEGYTQGIKSKLEAEKESPEGYSQRLKEKLGADVPGSTIANVKAGKVDLEPLNRGTPYRSFGFRLGAAVSNRIQASGDSGTRLGFKDMYGTKWFPDFRVNVEWYPFNSEYLGNLAFGLGAGLVIVKGFGQFEYAVSNNSRTSDFSQTSETEFRFAYIPIEAIAKYRFNLFRVLRPFALLGAMVIPFEESRSDGKDSQVGYSTAIVYGAGLSLWLDWISSRDSFNLYRSSGVKSYYLNVEYRLQAALSGPLNFDQSGLYAGFSFDM